MEDRTKVAIPWCSLGMWPARVNPNNLSWSVIVWCFSWISTTVTFISRVIFWTNSRCAAVHPSTLICRMTNGSSPEAIASRPDKDGLWFWVRLAADESFEVGNPGVWPLVSMLCMLLLISLAQMSYPGGRRGRISSSRPEIWLWTTYSVCWWFIYIWLQPEWFSSPYENLLSLWRTGSWFNCNAIVGTIFPLKSLIPCHTSCFPERRNS